MEINLAFFLLAVAGMSHIVVDGSIFKPVRDVLKRVLPARLYAGVECYQCSGFWCGILLGVPFFGPHPADLFACGCAGSLASNFVSAALNYLFARSIVDVGGSDAP